MAEIQSEVSRDLSEGSPKQCSPKVDSVFESSPAKDNCICTSLPSGSCVTDTPKTSKPASQASHSQCPHDQLEYDDVEHKQPFDHSPPENKQELDPKTDSPLQDSLVSHEDSPSSLADTNTCPYHEGAILTFKVRGGSLLNKEIKLRVLQVFQPFTLSCVMKVQPIDTQDSECAVLKVYDRRFAAQLRDDYDVEVWSAACEASYTDFIAFGRVAEFRQSLRDPITGRIHEIRDLDDSSTLEPETWSLDQGECFIHEWCKDISSMEIKAYNRLHDVQGTIVSRLLSEVAMSTEHPPLADPALAEIPGLLLEFIPGVTIDKIPITIPRNKWQSIVDSAISAVNVSSDHDILNLDVRPSNILVSSCSTSECGFRTIIIDFDLTRLRAPDDTEEAWGRRKNREEEEGAVGYVMRNRLRNHDFQLLYHPSGRYSAWADREP